MACMSHTVLGSVPRQWHRLFPFCCCPRRAHGAFCHPVKTSVIINIANSNFFECVWETKGWCMPTVQFCLHSLSRGLLCKQFVLFGPCVSVFNTMNVYYSENVKIQILSHFWLGRRWWRRGGCRRRIFSTVSSDGCNSTSNAVQHSIHSSSRVLSVHVLQATHSFKVNW